MPGGGEWLPATSGPDALQIHTHKKNVGPPKRQLFCRKLLYCCKACPFSQGWPFFTNLESLWIRHPNPNPPSTRPAALVGLVQIRVDRSSFRTCWTPRGPKLQRLIPVVMKDAPAQVDPLPAMCISDASWTTLPTHTHTHILTLFHANCLRKTSDSICVKCDGGGHTGKKIKK